MGIGNDRVIRLLKLARRALELEDISVLEYYLNLVISDLERNAQNR